MEFSVGASFMEYFLGGAIALITLYIVLRMVLAHFFPRDRK
jgi:hypothetical protein